jgi:hypothetical protein
MLRYRPEGLTGRSKWCGDRHAIGVNFRISEKTATKWLTTAGRIGKLDNLMKVVKMGACEEGSSR